MGCFVCTFDGYCYLIVKFCGCLIVICMLAGWLVMLIVLVP